MNLNLNGELSTVLHLQSARNRYQLGKNDQGLNSKKVSILTLIKQENYLARYTNKICAC